MSRHALGRGEQVPRGKDEKDCEKRVKECLKLLGGKRMGAGDVPRSDVERRFTGPSIDLGLEPMRFWGGNRPANSPFILS